MALEPVVCLEVFGPFMLYNIDLNPVACGPERHAAVAAKGRDNRSQAQRAGGLDAFPEIDEPLPIIWNRNARNMVV